MTTDLYVLKNTSGILSLVRDSASENDESSLTVNQYFALMICTDYQSYLRNYKEYKGDVNKNITYETYDIGIAKASGDYGFYVSKTYRNRYNADKGRTIIVNVSDTTKCIIL